MGWATRGSNPGGVEILRSSTDRPWGSPSFVNNGYRVFSGCKAAGAWRLPPTSSAEVKESVELYLLPFWVFVACCRLSLTFTFILTPCYTATSESRLHFIHNIDIFLKKRRLAACFDLPTPITLTPCPVGRTSPAQIIISLLVFCVASPDFLNTFRYLLAVSLAINVQYATRAHT